MASPLLIQRAESRYEGMDFSIDGLLVNPFRDKDPQEMEELIAKFFEVANIGKLENLSLQPHLGRHPVNLVCSEEEWNTVIRKGAYLAQDDLAFLKERDDGLSLKREEEEALQQEKHNKWNQPFILYALVGCCSMGAAVQGWYVYSSSLLGSSLTCSNAFRSRVVGSFCCSRK